ncbi:hypothetical protein LEP1GSC038_2022 [Leptospira weilii str. 2006001855]|uniref:Uncharacterized protein n=1 Tax=Leptospira weilii str. 2006001855 TaxID=996804 RepID=M6FJU1_9LEPT|nr:hypothetical protein LEP1GSC038_2022 [Leptospira weilii str. 2006001855]
MRLNSYIETKKIPKRNFFIVSSSLFSRIRTKFGLKSFL